MKKELVIKRCSKCQALVEVIKDCTSDNCSIKCCGEEMIELAPPFYRMDCNVSK